MSELVYNPYAYEMHEDPYPTYTRMREEAPLYRNEELGFWALSKHADVLAGFKDHARLSNRFGVSIEPSAANPNAHEIMSFLGMDPPRHDHMRALVSRGFTPRRIANLEPNIRKLATQYIDRFIDAGRCDFIAEFAGRLPMDIISEMLGVPDADRIELRKWADTVVHREEGMFDVPPESAEASIKLVSYFSDFLKERRSLPQDDLTTALIEAELDGDKLSDSDIVAFLFLMIIAGNETTTKLLGNAIYWLSKFPSERDLVNKDPKLIADWVEETLRFDNSSQALARTALEDMEMYGQTIRSGDRVVLLVGSANRDETVFEHAERLDIRRDTSNSLSFGRGTHFCLGAALARLEGRVSLEEVQKRLPDFEIMEDGIERVHSVNVRGFAALPIEFGQA